jgi:hypothetical protein
LAKDGYLQAKAMLAAIGYLDTAVLKSVPRKEKDNTGFKNANAFDSIGEVYAELSNTERAIRNYE